MIELTVDVGSGSLIDMEIDEPTVEIENAETDYHGGGGGTKDYEKLDNLPYLNDTLIKGRIYESDPTVPQWAKESTKPAYDASEINAVNIDDVVQFKDIDNILNTLWN